MKRVVGYLRKGVRGANKREQKREIELYCDGEGVDIIDWIEGDSFGEIAFGDWLSGRKVDAVVVADSDYVSDDMYEFYAYKGILKRRHSDLIAVRDRWAKDIYKVHDTVIRRFIDVMCRIELENKPLKRPNDRMDKAARGAYIGGNVPMGYKAENGRLVVNPDEVPVVLLVMERKHAGKTMLSTVDVLNQNGYKTRRGKPFVISTVQSIWHNEEFYRGFYRYSKDSEWVKGQHEAILKD